MKFVDVDVEALAKAYNKPVLYVEKCLDFHGIKELPKFRTPDDGFGGFYSDMSAHFDTTPSMTKQEFAAELDINNIMNRFIASDGDPTVLTVNTRKAKYGDFTQMPDSYHSAMNYVIETKNEFMKLDAELRARFNNDPQLFLNFVADPKNHDELVRLGIVIEPQSSPDSGNDVSGKPKKTPKPSLPPSNGDSDDGDD